MEFYGFWLLFMLSLAVCKFRENQRMEDLLPFLLFSHCLILCHPSFPMHIKLNKLKKVKGEGIIHYLNTHNKSNAIYTCPIEEKITVLYISLVELSFH